MFTFNNISESLYAKDIPKIVRSIDDQDVVQELANAKEQNSSKIFDFIIFCSPRRSGETLLKDIANLGKTTPTGNEQTVTTLINALQKIVANVEIYLQCIDFPDKKILFL